MKKVSSLRWITAKGESVFISEMSNDHLINAIKYMERTAPDRLQERIDSGYQVLSGLRGEEAIYMVECELSRMESLTPEQYLASNKHFLNLLKEASKRKLIPGYILSYYKDSLNNKANEIPFD